MPELTIIIATYNRGDLAVQTIRQILRQDFTDYELLVIDQSSEEVADQLAGALMALADPRLQYRHLAHPSITHARNQGLAHARGRIVLFLDDDVLLLSPDFLAAHVACYDDTRIGGVTGRVVERSNRPNRRHTACGVGIGGRTQDNLLGFERTELQTLKGLNMSYRASVFAAVGGFDRNYTGTALLEEADLSTRVRRAGWKLVFEPAAEVVHLSSRNGGVRVENAIATQRSRFHCTAYFLVKNRGLAALLPFAATFGLIAAVRALRWRRLDALPCLAAAAWDGARCARRGPDHAIDGGALGARGANAAMALPLYQPSVAATS